MGTFRAMNTTFRTTGITKEQDQRVKRWIRYVETNLSRFLPNSELSQLNQNPSVPFMASEVLYAVISLAEQYYRETGGCFHPFMGQLLSEWGYEKSFEQITYNEVDFAQAYHRIMLKKNGDTPVILDAFQKSIQLASTVKVDLGGIAKGWSVQKISLWLREEGVRFGVIDGGGDLVLWGMDSNPQPVGIADPFDPAKDIALFWISSDVGMATSSTMKRRWTDHQGIPIHHLLDSRTCCPSQSDVVQATVIAPDLSLAEVYAKCLVIKGTQGFPWLQNIHPEMAYIVVTDTQQSIISSNIKDYCHHWEVF